ncbi:MAG: ABC transporter permease [Planctomycetes bacterium]|nr:ABC transporter permease [Planctomycetota bacterium]
MQKILKIAQREYIETVKTKSFILGIVMVPFMIGGIIFFTSRMSLDKTGPRPTVNVAVTDLSNELAAEIKASFDKYNQENPKRQIRVQKLKAQEDSDTAKNQARNKLGQGQLDAYVVLDRDILEGSGKIHLYTYKPKASNLDIFWTIENIFRKAVVNQRYKMQNLSPELLAKLRHVPIERVEMGSADGQDRVQGETDRFIKMMVPFFFMYLIFMGIVGTGQHMISSVIEEKTSRVIEVLLSAVSPFQLMSGKILGLGGIGLTVVSLWAGAAYLTARWQGLNIDITAELALYFVIYYILGFLLFSSILAAIGSICNTIKETQSLMMPIMMVFIIPLLSWFKIVQSPDGTLARVFSFLPPLTPMVMILRLSAGSDIWIVEIIASIVLLALTVLAAMWAAAKVFRAGILMYGKRLGLREICRCLRQS